MQLSYDYARDRALMCLRANYESHLRVRSSLLNSEPRRITTIERQDGAGKNRGKSNLEEAIQLAS